jgi:hypothetical protein
MVWADSRVYERRVSERRKVRWWEGEEVGGKVDV